MGIVEIKSRALEEFSERLLDEVSDFIFQKSQEIIVEKGIIDESTLLKSSHGPIRSKGKRVINYAVPYADSIEFGRLPGSQPPVDPIKNWVRRKLGVKDEKEVNRIAWAIATDIKKNGLLPMPYLQPAIEAAKHHTFNL